MIVETVPDALAGERIDRVVAVVCGCTRADAAHLVDDGRVQLNATVVTSRSRRVALDDEVRVEPFAAVASPALTGDPSVAFDVVFADEHIVVIDKPAGLVVHPGAGNDERTLVHGLLARFPEIASMASQEGDAAMRPGIVHRLDKGTSGLLVVGRNPAAVRSLIAQLAARTVSRHYLALAWGRFESSSGLIDAAIGRSDTDPTRMAVRASGREARTRYQVERSFSLPDPLTLVECWLETGRTHQIRVHLAAIGHPVLGDERYGGVRNAVSSPRPWLHARSLAFDHPVTGRRVEFRSDVPRDLAAVLEGLR